MSLTKKQKSALKKGCLSAYLKQFKKVAILGTLSAGLAFSVMTPSQSTRFDYNLPKEISVIETTLPFETRKFTKQLEDGTTYDAIDKIVKTDSVDWSDDFYIKTDRYRLSKHDDFSLSRGVGWLVSLPRRLMLFDYDVSNGLDAQRTKAVISMLEKDKTIDDLYVRINHNEVWEDLGRLFSDPQVTHRNNFLARSTLGISATFTGEMFAEISRGDYYNSMTKTMVLYSNVEGVSAHELGHYDDFMRFDSDWGYTLGRVVPPVMLYQEWKASINSLDHLSKEDQNHLPRYLLPAFITYLALGFGLSKHKLQTKNKSASLVDNSFNEKETNKDFFVEKAPEDVDLDAIMNPVISSKNKISVGHTLAHFASINASFYAGIEAYNAAIEHAAIAPELFGALGFATTMVLSQYALNGAVKYIKPYKHQKSGSQGIFNDLKSSAKDFLPFKN